VSVATACTAVAAAELPLARLLAEDLRRVRPEVGLVVLVLDGDPPAGEPFEAIGVDALGLARPGLLELVTRDPLGLALALRPALMAWTVERHGGTAVWIEATVRLLGGADPLAPLVAAAAADGVAAVPLHPRGERPAGLGTRGAFECGLLAAGDRAALRWWAEATVADACRSGAAFDPLADRQVAALLATAERARVLTESGLCAGWWTLAAGRAVVGDPLAVDGHPLGALNLAGFDPRRPFWLSSEDIGGRAQVSGSPALAALLEEHARRLLAAGWRSSTVGEWRYAELADGVAVDDATRDLWALAHAERDDLGSPFEPTGREQLLDWLDGEAAVGGGVTRYLERVRDRRPDLRGEFADLGAADGPRLVRWMDDHGVAEEPLLALLAARRAEAEPSPTVAAGADAPSASAARGEAPPGAAWSQPAVRVVGYLRDGLGLGEAARSYVGALAAAGADVEAVAVSVPLQDSFGTARPLRRQSLDWRPPARLGAAAPDVEIVCANPPELARLGLAPPTTGSGRIGVWAWELGTLPAGWDSGYALVDELWVYSEYVAGAFAGAPVPVAVMPIPVDVERLSAAAAARPADSGEPFTFLFACDLLSTVERKNPLGLIAAFKAAFEPGEGPRLRIKTSNGANRVEELERLRIAALGRPDIEIVDAFLTVPERDALIAGCDCYVSLHRAEGFGLTLAEAMAAGRPAIATGFSGNLDFMTAETAYLVESRPVAVEAGSEIYPAGATWHEPDLDDAATALRAVYDDQAAARERGERGREHVRALLAPETVGAWARARIEQLDDHVPAPRRTAALRRRIARRVGG
jgi:glycosyltransferase involved in cell wall biosynthesis